MTKQKQLPSGNDLAAQALEPSKHKKLDDLIMLY